jgi:hypothetical protein
VCARSTNPTDQNKAATELMSTAQSLVKQLEPSPTPTPQAASNFLNLPNLNLPSLLSAATGGSSNTPQQQPQPQQQQQQQQQGPNLASLLPGGNSGGNNSQPQQQQQQQQQVRAVHIHSSCPCSAAHSTSALLQPIAPIRSGYESAHRACKVRHAWVKKRSS